MSVESSRSISILKASAGFGGIGQKESPLERRLSSASEREIPERLINHRAGIRWGRVGGGARAGCGAGSRVSLFSLLQFVILRCF